MFDEVAIIGDCGKEEVTHNARVGKFEEELYKVDVPGKSLVGIDVSETLWHIFILLIPISGSPEKGPGDCQTWIVESANQLVKYGIFKLQSHNID